MSIKTIFLLILNLVFLRSGFGSEESLCKDVPVSKIKRIVKNHFDDLTNIKDSPEVKLPGGAITINISGKNCLILTNGYSDIEKGILIDQDSAFSLASVSKQITAYAAKVVPEIQTDKLVSEFYSNIPSYMKDIRVAHLLQNTSGIRDYLYIILLQGMNFDAPFSNDDVIDLMWRDQSLNFTQGSSYSYSNSNWVLLAKIIEQVQEKTFAQHSRDNVFLPLEMNDTFFYDQERASVIDRPKSYRKKAAGGFVHFPYNFTVSGPSGVITTIKDFTTWLLHFDKIAMSDSSYYDKLYLNGASIDKTDEIRYNMGLILQERDGIFSASHSGEMAGNRSFMIRYPNHHLSLGVLTNFLESSPESLTHKVFMALHDSGFFKKHIESELLENVIGTYRSELIQANLSISYNNNESSELIMRFQNGVEGILTPMFDRKGKFMNKFQVTIAGQKVIVEIAPKQSKKLFISFGERLKKVEYVRI